MFRRRFNTSCKCLVYVSRYVMCPEGNVFIATLNMCLPIQQTWRCFGVFTVNIKHISHLFPPVFHLISAVSKQVNVCWVQMKRKCKELRLSPIYPASLSSINFVTSIRWITYKDQNNIINENNWSLI